MSFYFTEEGFKKIKAEAEELERYIKVDIAKALSTAAAHGDLRENAEYAAAKENQAVSMAKLREMRDRITQAQIVQREEFPEDTVTLCKKVYLKDHDNGAEFAYTILGEGESDIDNDIISYETPIAQALIGHKKGEVVDVELPVGVHKYEILDIKFFLED